MDAKTKRTYNPRWQDRTRNTRQAQRNQALNALAQSAGWTGWSEFATAVIKEQTHIPPKKTPR